MRDNVINNAPSLKQQKLYNAAIYNVRLGLAYLKQGNRLRAKKKLLTALDLAPNSPDVNTAMGFFLENTGDIYNARSFYKKALALAPHNGSQLNNYGAFLCRRGYYKTAETYFLQAVTDVHYVNSAGAYENAGLCAMAVPNYTKAIYFFKKALQQDPGRKQSLAKLAYAKQQMHTTSRYYGDDHEYNSGN